jgi:hypothetical protein
MDKIAAEKIASDYYNAGVQLALANAGLTKTANKKTLLSLLGGAGLGAGVSAVPAAMSRYEAMMAQRAANQGLDQLFTGLNKGMVSANEMVARGGEGMAGAVRDALRNLGQPARAADVSLGETMRFGPPRFMAGTPGIVEATHTIPASAAKLKIPRPVPTGAGPGIALPGSGSAGGTAAQNMEYLDKLIKENPPLVGPPSNLAEALTQSQMAEILQKATSL